jgi:hypothetical protein
MRLVGVAGQRRGFGQIRRSGRGVEHADETLEAEHALQCLRAVADRRVAAPAQLADGQAHVARHVLGARGRVAQQHGGPGHGGVQGAVGDKQAGDVEEPGGRVLRVKRRGQPFGGGRQQVGQGDPLIADLAQRQAKHAATRPGAEPDAEDDRARLARSGGRAGVGPGHVAAGAFLPDEVAASVGQHERLAVSVIGDDAGPQAGHG